MKKQSLLRISEAASLAIHALMILADDEDHKHNTRDMAKALDASEAHLSKVMQRLARAGLIHSVRGPQGGFSLAKEPSRTTLLEIFEAIDGPLSHSTCLLGNPVCRKPCILGNLLHSLNDQVETYLARTTLMGIRI